MTRVTLLRYAWQSRADVGLDDGGEIGRDPGREVGGDDGLEDGLEDGRDDGRLVGADEAGEDEAALARRSHGMVPREVHREAVDAVRHTRSAELCESKKRHTTL